MDAWFSQFKEEPWDADLLTEGMTGFGDGKLLSLGVLKHMLTRFLGIVVEDSNVSSQVTAQYVLKIIQQRGVRNRE